MKLPGSAAPQFCVYLFTEGPRPVGSLIGVLPDYEMVLPRSKNDIAFIGKKPIQSREQFKLEYERVASVIAPLLSGDAHLSCQYDDERGTRFQIELYRTENGNFVETNPPSYIEY